MKEIKVVIRANFGDEGKGQMTEYFAYQAMREGKSCLVVCYNGTAQRGHTCILEDGSRHVYHHFGAGTAVGADTYFSKDFVINPIFFRLEYNELKKKGYHPKVFVNGNCRMAVPYDMMINQAIETLRGRKRHGSCGFGLLESILRNKQDKYKTIIKESYNLKKLYGKLKSIQNNYLPKRLNALDLGSISDEGNGLFLDDDILSAYIEDVKFFLSHTTLIEDSIMQSYEQIIFEGAQGLLLDMDNMEYFPHLTPSKTGLYNPYRIIKELGISCPVEVCYVTRTYLTRHGAGQLNGECKKEAINPDMVDLTNVQNTFQESLRYGKLDVMELEKRIQMDFQLAISESNFTCAMAVMHENEYYVKALADEKYHSNGPAKEDIYKQEI